MKKKTKEMSKGFPVGIAGNIYTLQRSKTSEQVNIFWAITIYLEK